MKLNINRILDNLEKKTRIENLEDDLYNLFIDYKERCLSYEEYEREVKKIHGELDSLGYYDSYYEED